MSRITFVFTLILLCSLVSRSQEPKLILPIGHTKSIDFAAFSNDNKTVITCAADNSAKLWDARTGDLLQDLKDHASRVKEAVFAPDGKTVITLQASGDDVNFWDIQTGKKLFSLPKGEHIIFSPDRSQFALSSFSQTVEIYSWNTKEILSTISFPKYIVQVQYSHDGKRIAAIDHENVAYVYDLSSSEHITSLVGHRDDINSIEFSNDDKFLLTSSDDSTAGLWNAGDGSRVKTYTGSNRITGAAFSPDNRTIAGSSWDEGYLWQANTGDLIQLFEGSEAVITRKNFSSDGKYLAIANKNSLQLLTSAGKLIREWEISPYYSPDFIAFSNDNTKIVTALFLTSSVWEIANGNKVAELEGHSSSVRSVGLSPDKNLLIATQFNDIAKIWDLRTNTSLVTLKGHTSAVVDGEFSGDGTKVVTASWDYSAIVWDASSGNNLLTLNTSSSVHSASFSPDAKRIITGLSDGKLIVWNAETGASIVELSEHTNSIRHAYFSPNNKYIISVGDDNKAKLWDANSYKLLHDFSYDIAAVNASFSDDSKRVVISSGNGIDVRETSTGRSLLNFDPGKINYFVDLINDDKVIVTSSGYGPVGLWDAETGNEVSILNLEANYLVGDIDPSLKRIIAVNNSELSIFDLETLEKQITLVGVDSSDHLVYDPFGRYDGSAAARKLIYFNCGDELITLDQVKDQLWVPNLGERVFKKEMINSVQLSQLNICGLTPKIESFKTSTGYEYRIDPRKGGLGETILYVNGIATKRYSPSALQSTGGNYKLTVSNADIEKYFVDGQENTFEVKAYTKNNDISSRGEKTVRSERLKVRVVPNLHAVIIGVSDYKGEGLDLKFAAKDATDIGSAIKASASKLLGKDHVFIYELNTGPNKLAIPEKNSIKKIFEDLRTKTTPNDIVLVFFAGHGTVQGDNKQFYFLTADASPALISPTTVQNIGISAAELTEWMKPEYIRAQKRILILDACNSGQAIDQIIAARNDNQAEQIKQIDKLNEKAGLYVLAASAGDQSAYEMGRYSQGILTYSLLTSIKERPDILINGKYLNVTNWFNASLDLVYDIVRENNLNQQPQLITTTSFDLGIVDEEVMESIKLPEEKTVFGPTNFQNSDEEVMDDDLELSKMLNAALNKMAGISENNISYSQTASKNAWTLTGRYTLSGGDIVIKANLKQNNEIKFRFEVKGKSSDLASLAQQVIEKAVETIK